MMVKILIYAYCVGVFSSRRMQRRLVEDVAFQVLAAGNQPDFRTLSDFRKQHLEALEELFQQVLRITLATGTMKLGRVALDGSKVQANASKHKAMSYARMKETEKRLREEVRRLLEQAEAIDEEEDARYWRDRGGDELPAELARRETRIQKIREAKRALEERARAEAESKGQPPEESQPKGKDQFNFTDPASRIMKGPVLQAYNTQIAVEPDFQLIVGQTVTPEENDKQQMEPLLETIRRQSGTEAQGGSGRQRVLLGEESALLGPAVDRPNRTLFQQEGRASVPKSIILGQAPSALNPIGPVSASKTKERSLPRVVGAGLLFSRFGWA